MTSETVPQWICQSLWRLESPSSLSRVQMSPAWWAVQKKNWLPYQWPLLPQHYEVEFLLHQTWEDPRLAHLKEGRLSLQQLFNMRYVSISFFSGHPTWGHSHIKQGFGSQTSSWSSMEHSRCFWDCLSVSKWKSCTNPSQFQELLS